GAASRGWTSRIRSTERSSCRSACILLGLVQDKRPAKAQEAIAPFASVLPHVRKKPSPEPAGCQIPRTNSARQNTSPPAAPDTTASSVTFSSDGGQDRQLAGSTAHSRVAISVPQRMAFPPF